MLNKASCSCKNTGDRGLLVGILVAGVCLLVGFSMGYFAQFSSILRAQSPPSGSCTDPVTRREWRSLTHRERTEYFRAVNCLSTKPSRLGLNHTLYDEFSWVHREIGQYCECAWLADRAISKRTDGNKHMTPHRFFRGIDMPYTSMRRPWMKNANLQEPYHTGIGHLIGKTCPPLRYGIPNTASVVTVTPAAWLQ